MMGTLVWPFGKKWLLPFYSLTCSDEVELVLLAPNIPTCGCRWCWWVRLVAGQSTISPLGWYLSHLMVDERFWCLSVHLLCFTAWFLFYKYKYKNEVARVYDRVELSSKRLLKVDFCSFIKILAASLMLGQQQIACCKKRQWAIDFRIFWTTHLMILWVGVLMYLLNGVKGKEGMEFCQWGIQGSLKNVGGKASKYLGHFGHAYKNNRPTF